MIKNICDFCGLKKNSLRVVPLTTGKERKRHTLTREHTA